MGTAKREKSLLAKLQEFTSTKKAYWILWRFKVMYQEQSFDEFSRKYLNGIAEKETEKYMLESDVQKAIIYLKKVLHQKNLIELYDIYFEKAKSDTQAFRAFTDFSKAFFADEKESELAALLNGVDLEDGD